ncbi:hypothetical protein Ahy_A09g042559 [Arachis hypogaea]|uniref:Uncharacterized protein n=1 Tax=Arachis hypogaea TaxID=3818 RepID=A0A445BG92_ARAHY|nr:hypothetical protein Ahy_A09g042559 [Arachis hypogaea]
MSWTTHFLNLCDWYIHLLCTSPTKSIHFHSPNWQTVSTSHPSYYNEQCIIAAHMKTEAITEYRFGEEAERSDRSGGQCGHRDVRAEEEGDGNDNNES